MKPQRNVEDTSSAQRTERNVENTNETLTIPNGTARSLNDTTQNLRRPQEYFEWLGEPFTLNGTRYQSAVSNGIVMDLFAPKQS